MVCVFWHPYSFKLLLYSNSKHVSNLRFKIVLATLFLLPVISLLHNLPSFLYAYAVPVMNSLV
jgi:hypothetical protein